MSDTMTPTLQPVAYGGVTGRIQTLSSRGGLRFTLFDTLFDRAVSCYLAEGQEELMRDVWGRMAVVEGLVTRDRATGRPQVIRSVRGVTVVRGATGVRDCGAPAGADCTTRQRRTDAKRNMATPLTKSHRIAARSLNTTAIGALCRLPKASYW